MSAPAPWEAQTGAHPVKPVAERQLHQGSQADGYVLLLLPRPPWAADWAAASARAAPVLHARVVKKTRHLPPDYEPEVHLVPSQRLRPGSLLWPINGRIAGRALVNAVDQFSAEGRHISLVHSHFYAGSAGLPYLLARRGLPYVVTEHSSALTFCNPEKEVSRIGMKLAASVYRSASFVMPVSRSLADNIRKRELPGNLEVVPNPVDTDLFVPQLRGSGSRIVTAARLTPVKRLDLLLRAVQAMVSTGSKVHLDVIGDGPSRVSLTELAQSIGIADRVTFHGWMDRRDMPQVLGRGSVFALSSVTENLPVAMLEALSCGLPVVGPRVGGIPEIVEGAPGAVCQPGDVTALANVLRHWIDPSDREKLEARNVALERYSIGAVASRLRSIYQRTIE